MSVSFVRKEEELLNATVDIKISLIKIIGENLTLINKKKQSIMWNKPTIVDASILELSKLFMLEFHYNVMKKRAECVLLYSDSFIYKLKTKNLESYNDLEKICISKAISISQVFQQITNSIVDRTKKFPKVELAATSIQEVCALKPKMYSILVGNGKTK